MADKQNVTEGNACSVLNASFKGQLTTNSQSFLNNPTVTWLMKKFLVLDGTQTLTTTTWRE